jgi:uncharacterized protein (DUF1330 family)
VPYRNTDATQKLQTNSGQISVPVNTTGDILITCQQLTTWEGVDLSQVSWQVVDDLGAQFTAVAGVATVTNHSAKWLKFRVKNTTATECYLKDFSMLLAMPFSTTPTEGETIRVSEDVPDYAVLSHQDVSDEPLIEEYRVVGMTALVTFMGNALNSDGQIAGTRMEGGDDPDDVGLVDFSSIASAQGARDFPLKKGMYLIWKPSDEQDMAWRNPDDDDAMYKLPSLIFAGTSNTTTPPRIRLKVVMAIEATTNRMVFPTTWSRIDRYELESARLALQGAQLINENPLHWEDVKRVLMSVYNKGNKFYTAIKPALPYVQKAAEVLGPLALAALA